MSGGEERWVISYADMVTLLFALFTALYALGIQDKAKASLLSASIQEALDRPLSQKMIYQPPTRHEALPRRAFFTPSRSVWVVPVPGACAIQKLPRK
jgi:flagellar motor protein MotB